MMKEKERNHNMEYLSFSYSISTFLYGNTRLEYVLSTLFIIIVICVYCPWLIALVVVL